MISRRTAIDLASSQEFGCAQKAQATIVWDIEANLVAKLAERPSNFTGDGSQNRLALSVMFSALSILAIASSCYLLRPFVQSRLPNADRCPVPTIYSASFF
ncbi:MAG: hypothetical protein ACFB9N_13405 [Geitlerinemataceae cyanobacterium]